MKRTGFTLVELIVVVTILAILGTIGFISYNGYLVGVRDSNRTTQLGELANGLELYRVKNTLPLPDKPVSVKVNGTIIGYQGYAGQDQLDLIDYSKGGKDPKDGEYFTYYLTADRKKYQLLAFLEDSSNQTAGIWNTAYAADYSVRFPTTTGKKLGVLLETSTNIPIQIVGSIVSSGTLDIGTTTNTYTAQFSDKSNIQGTGGVLKGLDKVLLAGGIGNIGSSCKNYLDRNSSLLGKNGIYSIYLKDLPWTFILDVYCDMTTDGGGWTLVLAGLDSDIGMYDARGNSQWTTTNLIPYQSLSQSFKLSDVLINTIRSGGLYKISASSTSGSDVFYVPSTCNYKHTLGNNGDCAKLYKNITFTSQVSCGGSSGRMGIGCRGGIITNHAGTSNILCYNNSVTGGGRCANNGENIKISLFVR